MIFDIVAAEFSTLSIYTYLIPRQIQVENFFVIDCAPQIGNSRFMKVTYHPENALRESRVQDIIFKVYLLNILLGKFLKWLCSIYSSNRIDFEF